MDTLTPFLSCSAPRNPDFQKHIERRRLLHALLLDRSKVRIVCAPRFYGKTSLVLDYARLLGETHQTFFIDCMAPQFLIELDTLVLQNSDLRSDTHGGLNASGTEHFIMSADEGEVSQTHQKLFIFDQCPPLMGKRQKCFSSFIASCLQAGCEVIIVTSTLMWEQFFSDSLVISAHDLLLDRSEIEQLIKQKMISGDQKYLGQLEAFASANQKKSDRYKAVHDQPSRVIGLWRDLDTEECEEDKQRFSSNSKKSDVESFSEESLERNRLVSVYDPCHAVEIITAQEEAFLVASLILGSGSVFELQSSFQADVMNIARRCERAYPLCAISSQSPSFSHPRLSDEKKIHLLRKHLSALTTQSVYVDEAGFLEALVGILMRKNDTLLAAKIVREFFAHEKQISFYEHYSESLVLWGEVLSLFELLSAMSTQELLETGAYQVFDTALCLCGETALIKQLTDTLESVIQEPENANKKQGYLLYQRLVDIFRLFSTLSPENSASTAPQRFTFDRDEIVQPLEKTLKAYLENRYGIAEWGSVEELVGAFELIDSRAATLLRDPLCCAACLAWVTLVDMEQSRVFFNKVIGPYSSKRQRVQYCLLFYILLSPTKRQTYRTFVVDLLMNTRSSLEANLYEYLIITAIKKDSSEENYVQIPDPLLQRSSRFEDKLNKQIQVWKKRANSFSVLNNSLAQDNTYQHHPTQKHIRINVFGRFDIYPLIEGVEISSEVGTKLRLLITFLVLHSGREIARSWIERVLWPNADERKAKHSFYNMWSCLNKSISAPYKTVSYFDSFAHSIALNEDYVESDLELLARYCDTLRNGTLTLEYCRHALHDIEDLYRGPLLPGEDNPEIEAARHMWQERLIEALLQGGTFLLRRGESKLAYQYFAFAFEQDKSREDCCRFLMETLRKLDRHGEALASYLACRKAQIERFGIEGTAGVRTLYEEILKEVSQV